MRKRIHRKIQWLHRSFIYVRHIWSIWQNRQAL